MFEAFVASVDVVDTVDDGGSAGSECGDDEGGRSAKVRCHDGCAVEFAHAGDDHGCALAVELGTHAAEFGNVEEPFGENAFGDDGVSFSDGEECHDLGLQVGGESRMGLGRDADGPEDAFGTDAAGGPHGILVVENVDVNPEIDKAIGDGEHGIEWSVGDGERAVGNGGSTHHGAGLDAVGDDGVYSAVEAFDAFDGDAGGACAGDACAHCVEEVGQIDDFGLAGCGFDDRGAFGQGGSGHDIGGPEDG